MLHFTATDFAVMDDAQKQQIRDWTTDFARKFNLYHPDMNPEHVVLESPTKPGGVSRIHFIDMADVRQLTASNNVDQCIANMLNKLQLQ